MDTLLHHSAAADVPLVEPITKKWSREEFYKLAELGWFQDQRVELIEGEIVVVSPQSFPHARSLHTTFQILNETFGTEYWVRSQLPLVRAPSSEPEPDISVVKGACESYSDHPTTALLVVEVSITTLDFDKSQKAGLYASMGVPDYWVLDLENCQLLVHRQPTSAKDAPFGHSYAQVEAIPADGHVCPLEKPDVKLAVANMLPPKK